MSLRKVGLLNHTGNLGSCFFNRLVALHEQRALDLVVFHRPNSNLTNVPQGVATRCLDLDASVDPEDVADVNVFISAVPVYACPSQLPVIEALVKSSSLEVFVPSMFGYQTTQNELKAKGLEFIKGKSDSKKLADELKLPWVEIENGIFDSWFFASQKTTTFPVYKDSLKLTKPLSSCDYVAAGTIDIALSPPAQVARKTFTLIEREISGEQLVDAIEKKWNRKLQIAPLSEAQWQGMVDAGSFSTLGAMVMWRWGTGEWGYIGTPWEVKDHKKMTVEELVQNYLPAAPEDA